MVQELLIDVEDRVDVEAGKQVACRLSANKGELVESWLQRLRADVPSAKKLTQPMLLDSLPGWLDWMIQALSNPSASFDLQKLKAKAKEHGRDRTDYDFQIEELLHEYVVLRQTIFEILERDFPLQPRQRDLILDAIQLSQRHAVAEYVKLRNTHFYDRLLQSADYRSSQKYLITAGVIALTTALQMLLWGLIYPLSYFLYYPAIVICALFGDGVLATFLSLVVTQYLFVPPYQLIPTNTVDFIRATVFTVTALTISFVTSGLRKSQRVSQGAVKEQEEARRLAQDAADMAKAARSEADQNIKELKSERDLREQFVSTISHDLRGPMSSSRLALQLLQSGSKDLANNKFILQAIRGIDRTNAMIENLLDVNRIRAGQKLTLELTTCDFVAVVRETLKDLEVVYDSRFVLETSQEFINGYCSSDGLRRIIENLCSNAVKYGGVDSPITVRLEEKRERVEISVHNLGSYIAPEDQTRLFEIFERTTEAKMSGQRGWGIGLSIVKAIAEAQGGSISVESSLQNGTIFQVLIPRDARPFVNQAS